MSIERSSSALRPVRTDIRGNGIELSPSGRRSGQSGDVINGAPGSEGRADAAALGLPLHSAYPCYILNRMVQFQRAHLDASFAALSDITRRGILEQLGRADASITDLAGKFRMTLTGMKKHVGVLEQAGLVTTEKVGRVRTCKLGQCRLEEEAAWIERYGQLWAARFDELNNIVEELKRKEGTDGRTKKK